MPHSVMRALVGLWRTNATSDGQCAGSASSVAARRVGYALAAWERRHTKCPTCESRKVETNTGPTVFVSDFALSFRPPVNTGRFSVF